MSIQCLTQAHSKLVKQWDELETKITIYYNEARDNAKFIQVMEKCCHSLYLQDPVNQKFINDILNILYLNLDAHFVAFE